MKRAIVISLAAGLQLTVFAHDEQSRIAVSGKADYQERLERVKSWQPEKADHGLAQKASLKLRKEALAARGMTSAEIAESVYGAGPAFAFPYIADPELRSTGTVKTLTILIDFSDYRAARLLPHLKVNDIRANIYESGTAYAKTQTPYDSLNGYYKRASQDKVNILGNVLGWYHFPNKRSTYQPNVAGLSRSKRAKKEKAAIFAMTKEALLSLDVDHDLAQYDNDRDGDIDLVTIMYAGPDSGWGSFWWAYRWEFDATEHIFNGKRVKQFVFQFVSTRNNGRDFDPTTLFHEMGHAFGLPDYYDYDPDQGPPGGLGQLDMMDHNWGNHNCFSRWLLDWIKPDIISLGTPSRHTLTSSGGADNTHKAIAIFPDLADSEAPTQELFMIENRWRVGNDGGMARMPGDGVLVWHVVANPNAGNRGFECDNSFSSTKLLRLVRADANSDFAAVGSGSVAGSTTYFGPDRVFTPSSKPNSSTYAGVATGVTVKNISRPGETVTLDVGFQSASRPPAMFAPPGPAPAPGQRLDLAGIESLSEKAGQWSAAELETKFQELVTKARHDKLGRQDTVALKVLMSRWAAKDGKRAMNALLGMDSKELLQEAAPVAMNAWVSADPAAAGEWYEGTESQLSLARHDIKVGPEFHRHFFEWAAQEDFSGALSRLAKISDPQGLVAAVSGMESVAATSGVPTSQIYSTVLNLPLKGEAIQALQLNVARKLIRETKHDSQLLDEKPGLREALATFGALDAKAAENTQEK